GRKLLVALDRGGEPRALPRGPAPGLRGPRAADRLARAALLDLAAEALRHRRAGGGLLERRSGRGAGRPPPARRGRLRPRARGGRARRGPSSRGPAAPGLLRPAPGPGGPGRAAQERDRDPRGAPPRALGLRAAAPAGRLARGPPAPERRPPLAEGGLRSRWRVIQP